MNRGLPEFVVLGRAVAWESRKAGGGANGMVKLESGDVDDAALQEADSRNADL